MKTKLILEQVSSSILRLLFIVVPPPLPEIETSTQLSHDWYIGQPEPSGNFCSVIVCIVLYVCKWVCTSICSEHVFTSISACS